MNHPPPLTLRITLNLLVVLMFAAIPECVFAVGGGAQSIQSFVELKDKWADFVGSSFRIEGHTTIVTKNYVKFKACDLTFRSSKPLPKLVGNSKVVEISGRMAKENDGKLFFEIESIKELPTDTQTVKQRENALSRASSKEWYELAEWTAARGSFYDDEELLKKAKALSQTGLKIERTELKEITPEALRKLAKRAKAEGLGNAQSLELRHEAYWLEWESLRKTPPPAELNAEIEVSKDPLFVFLKQLDAEFAGATVKVNDVLPLLANEYRRNPVLSYHNADVSVRPVFHRLFHTEVATVAIARVTKPDGSNGTEIADRIDELVPEQHALAEKHRDLDLSYQALNSSNLARTQLNDLVQRCRDRKLEDTAQESIKRWLVRREQSLRKDGVTGLIQLSDERLALQQDQDGAASLLLEAIEQTPTNTNITERLTKLGFKEVNGRWINPNSNAAPIESSVAQSADAQIEMNIRRGIPSKDMTPAQLLRCLGAPSSVTRIATAGQVTETWTYREGLIVRYTATIERRPNRGTAKVIAIQ
ncbi:MAG: hypothetical protein NT013_18825 [Planctomycetia bacterium]|nr:hypothetical protein [Planctomycetia bacterium]